MSWTVLCGFVLVVVFTCAVTTVSAAHAGHFTTGTAPAARFGVHEIVLSGDASVANPFDTVATVRFTPPSGAANAKMVWAFYDGGNTWRARVYANEVGAWTWSSTCDTDPGLAGKTGEFRCEASRLRGRLLIHPKNPRQWMTEDGRWFLNLNDTAYFLLRARDSNGDPVSDEDARQYVHDDVARGITSVRCFLACRKGSLSGPPEPWREWYFGEETLDRFRLDNLQCADGRLRMLLDEYPDLAVQVILFPLVGYKRDDRFWTTLTVVERERLLRYLVSRFAAYPQLLWLMTNDAHYGSEFPNNNAMVREVGAYLQQHDPWQHPRSTGHARFTPFVFGDEEWATYIHIEHAHDLGALQYGQYHAHAKPVFLGEDRYEQDRGNLDPVHMRYWQRRLFWAWLLSGGSTNYGGRWWAVHPYTTTGSRTATYHRRPEVTFRSGLIGLDSVRHIRDYFESRNIELSDFLPDLALATDKGVTDPAQAPKLMRRDWDEFLLYHPNAVADGRDANVDANRSARVRLDLQEAAGTFRVEWYRAADGETGDGGSIAGGGLTDLFAPWVGHDVVLRLSRP
jgi:hypothetical protein